MFKIKNKLLNLNVFIDNEYLDKYIELIEINRNTKREKFKTQQHHIIPRSYYKHNNLEIDNSKENLVNVFNTSLQLLSVIISFSNSLCVLL